MEKFVSKTADALARLGERVERHLSTSTEDDYVAYDQHDHRSEFGGPRSAFQRPLDKKASKNNYAAKKRDLLLGGAKNHSSDHLAASPSGSSFSNYRQNPVDRLNRPPYGTGIGAPLNYGYQAGYANAGAAGAYDNNGAVAMYGGNGAAGMYGGNGAAGMYGNNNGSVGYAPDYYIAERRQLELVPAPPPRIIHQQVPVAVPVDRPVPQPYPVHVPHPVPVDRPVPVPVPVRQIVHVDRPVPYAVPVDRPVPVPVPVPSPQPQQMQAPCGMPVGNPCYVPVGVPVPSPPPSPPVVLENSVTYTQRWITGSPVMMQQQQQQRQLAGSPVFMNQQCCVPGQPAMGMNRYGSYGNGYVG